MIIQFDEIRANVMDIRVCGVLIQTMDYFWRGGYQRLGIRLLAHRSMALYVEIPLNNIIYRNMWDNEWPEVVREAKKSCVKASWIIVPAKMK